MFRTASSADVAMDADGNAVAVWAESPAQVVKAASRPRGGAWLPAQTLSPDGQEGIDGVRVAMSASGLAVATVGLTTSWQQATVTYVPAAAGSSTLDLNAYVSGARPGACFVVDDVAIRSG